MKQAIFFTFFFCFQSVNASRGPAYKFVLHVTNNTNKKQELTFQLIEYWVSAELTKQMYFANQGEFSEEQLHSCDSEIHSHDLNLPPGKSHGLLFRTKFNQDAHRVVTIINRLETQQDNNLRAEVTTLNRQFKNITINKEQEAKQCIEQKPPPRKPLSFFSLLSNMCGTQSIRTIIPRKHSRAQTE